jgi:RNA polymerase sigma-70 factor (ECF subfamily)
LNIRYKNIHQKIIDQCKNGDRKAQFQLYKLYYKAMYNVCLHIINNNAEAEDVMQEAFLSAFDKIASYKGEVSFWAWLKRIAVNRSLDHLKKRKIKFEEINEETTQISDNYFKTKEIDIHEIKKAIQNLPDSYRIILSLYLIEGYDHEEISTILGISNSLSRTQLSRAKSRLKIQLTDKELL